MLLKHQLTLKQGSFFALLLLTFSSFAPVPFELPLPYPLDYFSLPVRFQVKMTGTFGELRSNHYHSGIDIKSPNGKVGHPIYAAADGFIDRINVSASGYGNAVYIKHPNGYKTVYGHLDAFTEEVAAYVKIQQYKKERFEVTLYPKDGQFSVKKGQQIGLLGNSGGSTGPHLHFEIRKTSNDKPINPLLFNLPIPDSEQPSIRGLKAYNFNGSGDIIGDQTIGVRKVTDGKYALSSSDTLRLANWRTGFSIKTYDSMTGFRNDNGTYIVRIAVDGREIFRNTLDAFSFSESRYLNAHIDYQAKKAGKGYYQRLYQLPGDKFKGYKTDVSKGVIELFLEKPQKIDIESIDANGNVSSLNFWVARSENVTIPSGPSYQYLCLYDQNSSIETSDLKLKMDAGALYSNLFLQYSTSADQSYGCYSSVQHIQDDATPLHKYIQISIRDADRIPEALRSKAIIAECNNGNRPINCGGEWKNGWVTSKVRDFGNYCLLVDTEAPEITPVYFQKNMEGKNSMSFRISDNYRVSGRAKDLHYRATVDGKWILMEFDGKKDRLTHYFDGTISKGEHVLRLVVTDDRENETIFQEIFVH